MSTTSFSSGPLVPSDLPRRSSKPPDKEPKYKRKSGHHSTGMQCSMQMMGLMMSMMTQTDGKDLTSSSASSSSSHPPPRPSTKDASSQTSDKDIMTESEIRANEDKRMDELRWKEIGRRVCQLKLEDFRGAVGKYSHNHIATRGEAILSAVRTNLSALSANLGSFARGTVFSDMTMFVSTITNVSVMAMWKRECNSDVGPLKRKIQMGKRARQHVAAGRVDEDHKEALQEHIQHCWKQDIHLSLGTMLDWAKANIQFPFGRTILADVLGGLGYCFRLKRHNPMIEERKDLIFLRGQFLKLLGQLKASNHFISCYDETWVFEGMTANYAWQMRSDTMYKKARMADIDQPIPGPRAGKNKGKRGIVVAVLTEEGVLPFSPEIWISGVKDEDQKADYHDEMESKRYEDYLRKMIPMIKKRADELGRPAALFIDNAKYHNRAEYSPPTSASTKGIYIDFLKLHGVDHDPKSTKPVLYKLIEQYMNSKGGRLKFYKFALDEWARKEGVEIVRIPPYHCFFNPIELMWAQLKRYLRTLPGSSTLKIREIKDKAIEFMDGFQGERAAKLYRHVEKYEEDVRKKIEEKEEKAAEAQAERQRKEAERKKRQDAGNEEEPEEEDDSDEERDDRNLAVMGPHGKWSMSAFGFESEADTD